MLKHELRTVYRNKRKLVGSESRLKKSIEISNRALQLPIWNFSFYHTFLSIAKNNEVDTEPLLSILHGKDKNIVVPKVVQGDGLDHFLLTDATELGVNAWGIPEPVDGIPIAEEKLDVVFVPLLAFDGKGNRVGYGKGFYDTFLNRCRPDVVKVGLSFFDPVAKVIDTSPHDVPLDFCVTPERVYSF